MELHEWLMFLHVLAAMVVDEDVCALRRERAGAGGADAARRTRDDHALALKPRVRAA